MHIKDRVKELRRVRASDLRPSPRNWRTHPPAQREALRGILAEVGYADALLARELQDGSLELVDGHLRAETTPQQMVPVLVLDVTEAEAAKLLVTIDPLAALAGTDDARLAELLKDLPTESEALKALFEGLARDNGLDELAGSPQVADDAPPLVPPEPVSRPGDLWALPPAAGSSLPPHRLLCGDAREPRVLARLMGGARADLVLTDPPYGVDYEGAPGSPRKPIANDGASGLRALLEASLGAALAVTRPGAAWYVCAPAGPQFIDFAAVLSALGVWRQTLVWVKDSLVLGRSDYHYRHECVLYGWSPGAAHRRPLDRTLDSVLEVPRPKASPEHPTMKPPALMARLAAASSLKGETVLDPFTGSGTSLVVAEQLGRSFRGLELEPGYVDVAVRRWMALTGREAVLESAGKGRPRTFAQVAKARGVKVPVDAPPAPIPLGQSADEALAGVPTAKDAPPGSPELIGEEV